MMRYAPFISALGDKHGKSVADVRVMSALAPDSGLKADMAGCQFRATRGHRTIVLKCKDYNRYLLDPLI
jgi:hypothetical protein